MLGLKSGVCLIRQPVPNLLRPDCPRHRLHLGLIHPRTDRSITEAFAAAAKTITDSSFKARAWAEIAVRYAKSGQREQAALALSEALATAKTIQSALKDHALGDITSSYAEAGQYAEALSTAKAIENVDSVQPGPSRNRERGLRFAQTMR